MIPPLGSRDPETRHLNLKWSVDDIDLVVGLARHGYTVNGICLRLKGTPLESTQGEILCLCRSLGQFVRKGAA